MVSHHNTGTPTGSTLGTAPPAVEHNPADEFQWLEDIYGEDQLSWVKEQNARTDDMLLSAEYEALEGSVLEVLDSTDRIPMVTKRGDFYYNFWRDEEHPRGLWRRTTWESYQSDAPAWDVLLDVDQLSRDEDVEWVFAGASLLRPEFSRALISLSPDGGDAKAVREFDVDSRSFVDGGFNLPSAKTNVSWVDQETIYVGTDFGPGSMTTSSYPRTNRRLRRGQSLDEAELVFEVDEDHMMAILVRDLTPGFERDIAIDIIDFYNRRSYLMVDGGWQQIDVPEDVDVDLHRNWILFRPQTEWTVGDTTYVPGSLLAADLEEFRTGDRKLTALFTPDENTALQSWSWTKDHLLLNLLRDVSSTIRVLTPGVDGWNETELDDAPTLHSVDAFAVDDEDEADGNDYWLVITGFLTPTTLHRGTIGAAASEIKASPSYFNSDDYTVEQHFATSKDGTQVPYFQVSSKDLKLDGGNPTLLSGYGGFQIARTPAYSGATGRTWLERRAVPDQDGDSRGGVYVVANIRGGGEYGPSWHRAALQENRHRAYEDFAAVAEDLIERDVTSRAHLGCEGRSNGGLLVGNMLTHYPHLFGAVSCGVPLLDMRRYTKLSAGYSWIAEYGDPDDEDQWEFIRTFSPYHNLRDGVDYPSTFIFTATSDDRVGPVQARKMAARMASMGIPQVWFYESLEGGHAGATDNRQAARLHSASHEFLWKATTGGL
ncbi:prolyl oligopeptidase family serine peptidase [Arthrobacter monumenti]